MPLAIPFDAFEVHWGDVRPAPDPIVSWVPNTPSGTWPAGAPPITFVLGGATSRDVGDDAGGELDAATRAWSQVACTAFRARFGGVRAGVTAGDDGVNAVVFHDDAWPAELVPGAIAQTIVTIDGSGKIRDADIHVNGKDFRFSLDGAPGTQDLRSVLTHEIGHALGLGHSADARATMYAAGSGLRWRSLEKDDEDGVCALYPGTGAAGCGELACPLGLVCVADVCQRPSTRADVCSPCDLSAGACEAAGDGARCVDIGEGATAGRVCGRACGRDADCGPGFACRKTTEAGDLQCISLDGCKSAANACAIDAECKNAVCRGGVCVGPREDTPSADGGAEAGGDGGDEAPTGGGEGCAFARGSRREPRSPLASLTFALLVSLSVLRRSPRRHR